MPMKAMRPAGRPPAGDERRFKALMTNPGADLDELLQGAERISPDHELDELMNEADPLRPSAP